MLSVSRAGETGRASAVYVGQKQMDAKLKSAAANLYDRDYLGWLDATIAQLRAGDYSQVNWANLIDELEAMSRRERKRLKRNLIVVLLHLLKWQFQPSHRTGSWRGSIREHRRRLREDLADSPSLVPYYRDIFAAAYTDARLQAADETGCAPEALPVESPYTPEQVLNADFLPASEGETESLEADN